MVCCWFWPAVGWCRFGGRFCCLVDSVLCVLLWWIACVLRWLGFCVWYLFVLLPLDGLFNIVVVYHFLICMIFACNLWFMVCVFLIDVRFRCLGCLVVWRFDFGVYDFVCGWV